VVLIVLDDMGFADLGCYGSRIATPHIDALASGGLRYNRFHVTALCSPTRACLMTGRNQHAVGMGYLADFSMGFPGYTNRIPKSAATMPRLLRDGGYSTFAVGKWHLAPGDEVGPAGPFDHWPLGMGFERYYGFVGGMTDQWRPSLVRDNSHIDPPESPVSGYHITEDLAAQAIRFLHDQQHAAPGRPFLLYFATGATHAPHQVGPEWAEPYRGRFDDGWDAMRGEVFARQQQFGVVPPNAQLTPRPSWVAPWDELSTDKRRLYARMMEVYAGFLTHTDAQIGRVLDYLSAMEVLDDTLVMVLSDNGASAEGGPHGYLRVGLLDVASMLSHIDEFGGDGSNNHYAWGWAWAGNTPFRLWKRYSWLGGVRVPLVVHWPARIPEAANGGVRAQFCHAIDIMPTILDAAGVTVPEAVDGVSQRPLDGTSVLRTIGDADGPNPRRTQYFETVGSRAIYHDGWKATTDHVDASFVPECELLEGSHAFETDRWSLFHLDNDFSEATDVAAEHPDRLQQLVELWWSEAGRNQVLPLVGGTLVPERVAAAAPAPVRTRYVYLPGGGPLTTPSPFLGHLVVDIDVRDDHDMCGIVCVNHAHRHGVPVQSGWRCYVLDGRLIVELSYFDDHPHKVVAEGPTLSGSHQIEIGMREDENTNSSIVLAIRLTVDGRDVGAGHNPSKQHFALTSPHRLFQGKLWFGRDPGPPMFDDYEPPFPFTGRIRRAVFTVPPLPKPESSFAGENEAALRYE
jgi:arylsulfatase